MAGQQCNRLGQIDRGPAAKGNHPVTALVLPDVKARQQRFLCRIFAGAVIDNRLRWCGGIKRALQDAGIGNAPVRDKQRPRQPQRLDLCPKRCYRAEIKFDSRQVIDGWH